MGRRSSDVVAALIELGRGGEPGIPDCLADEQAAWYALVRRKGKWRKVAEILSEAELRYLIRGLVLYSRARRRGIGGSVSPVIGLFYNYMDRFPEREPELAAWIVDNRVNCYDPFGSSVDGGARSHAQFLEHCRRRELEAEARQARRDQDAAQARTAKATPKLANAVRRGDLKAVVSLLAKGADPKEAIEGRGSIVELAEENGRDEVAAYFRSQGIT